MRTYSEIVKRCEGYSGYQMIYHDWGYVVWQTGTGDNVEILFIQVSEPRKGYGKTLLEEMKERIHPYHSVYVFRKESNENAGRFYRAIGFKETVVPHLYKGGNAVLGVIPFDKL